MSGTSATGGYLTPIDPQPTEDDLMDDAIQETIVGTTGLDPTLVRQRWQHKQPTQPPPDVSWCAVGIMGRTAIDYPYLVYLPDTNSMEMQRHEKIEVLASFYGDFDSHYAGLFRDGLYIPENLEYLNTFGIKLQQVGANTNVPELINSQWIGRTDIEFTLVRQLNRFYRVLNILSAKGFVHFTHGAEVLTPWKTP